MREYDSPWKETIAFYFRDFLLFFFPSIAEDIEWEFGFEFLDTELQKIKRETETGRKAADKLVKVWRKTGEEQWVFLHIEIVRRESRAYMVEAILQQLKHRLPETPCSQFPRKRVNDPPYAMSR